MPKEELYTQIVIKLTEKWDADMLVACLDSFGVEAFEERDDAVVAGGIEPAMDVASIEAWLQQNDLWFEKNMIANQNWNAQWEASFEPVRVNDFAGVRAVFHAPMDNVQHEIVITPKMSFGTGHHATTWLMMEQMQHLEFNGKSVIDFGTGTGILGILAEKLGASAIIGIDYDEWCIENAAENIEQNSSVRMQVVQKDSIQGCEAVPIILANINKHVILNNLQAMKDAVLPGGHWLLSGLLVADETDIKSAATEIGMIYHHTVERNGWIAMLFSRPE